MAICQRPRAPQMPLATHASKRVARPAAGTSPAFGPIAVGATGFAADSALSLRAEGATVDADAATASAGLFRLGVWMALRLKCPYGSGCPQLP